MIVDSKALASLYAQMSADALGSLKREYLTDEARLCYDREMERRSPGWMSRRDAPAAPEAVSPAEKLRRLLEMRPQIQKKARAELRRSSAGFGLLGLAGMALFASGQSFSIRLGSVLLNLAVLFCAMGMIAPDKSKYSTGYMILWLRRFHRRKHKDFLHALRDACRYLGMPITVQDSAVHFSQGFAVGQLGSFLYLLLPLLAIFGVLFVADADAYPLFFVALTLGFVVSVLALVSVRLWAYVRLRREPLKQAARLLRKIRGCTLRSGGVVVLRIEDRFWRQVVEMAIRQADVVVIDVTDPSENVIWELRTALYFRSPKTILLTCPQEENSPAVLPEPVTLVLQQFLGPVSVSRFPVFFYPAGKSFAKCKASQSDWSIGLRDALAGCISHAPPYEIEEAI